jgi:hypothetical protein
MTKFMMLLLVMVGMQAAAQTNPITGITISLPSNPDANTANWGSGTSQLNITANAKVVNGRVDGFVQESKNIDYHQKKVGLKYAAVTPLAPLHHPISTLLLRFGAVIMLWH